VFRWGGMVGETVASSESKTALIARPQKRCRLQHPQAEPVAYIPIRRWELDLVVADKADGCIRSSAGRLARATAQWRVSKRTSQKAPPPPTPPTTRTEPARSTDARKRRSKHSSAAGQQDPEHLGFAISEMANFSTAGLAVRAAAVRPEHSAASADLRDPSATTRPARARNSELIEGGDCRPRRVSYLALDGTEFQTEAGLRC